METATSQDIKYAPDTSALRNAGDAREVMDMAETTEVNENASDEYPGVYKAMENHYNPECHDIWGDGEDDQRNQKALKAAGARQHYQHNVPTASITAINNAGMQDLKQAAQSPTYDTTTYHVGPSAMDNGTADARRSDGLRLPDAAPPRARYACHPNIPQTAVRSSASRPDTDNQPPDTTHRTENNITAVWRAAPRPWHTTVRRNGTTSWRPRPLCYIGLMTHIILLPLHNGDGGVEPCSPPANTTNLTPYQNTTTHYGMANGGAERRSPPTMPNMTTVRSPAPRPCHDPNHTVNAAHASAQELHRRPGIHPVLNVTPLPSHTPQCSRTRNCRITAFSH